MIKKRGKYSTEKSLQRASTRGNDELVVQNGNVLENISKHSFWVWINERNKTYKKILTFPVDSFKNSEIIKNKEKIEGKIL